MASTTECELLIPASQDYVFRFYQDCYHWNVWFQGIDQSWFEQEPRPGVGGKVIFANGATWKLKVVTLHDDSIFSVRARRWGISLVFEAETERVREQLTRVSHRIHFPGLTGLIWRIILGKRLSAWLQTNLHVLHGYAELSQKEYQESAAMRKSGAKRRKRRKAKKNKP